MENLLVPLFFLAPWFSFLFVSFDWIVPVDLTLYTWLVNTSVIHIFFPPW
jgi:hypothetical protein